MLKPAIVKGESRAKLAVRALHMATASTLKDQKNPIPKPYLEE